MHHVLWPKTTPSMSNQQTVDLGRITGNHRLGGRESWRLIFINQTFSKFMYRRYFRHLRLPKTNFWVSIWRSFLYKVAFRRTLSRAVLLFLCNWQKCVINAEFHGSFKMVWKRADLVSAMRPYKLWGRCSITLLHRLLLTDPTCKHCPVIKLALLHG